MSAGVRPAEERDGMELMLVRPFMLGMAVKDEMGTKQA